MGGDALLQRLARRIVAEAAATSRYVYLEKPMIHDLEEGTLLREVEKETGKVLIVHEAVKTGGFGGELAATIAESRAFGYLDAPIVKINTADTPAPYSPVLLQEWLPNSEDVIRGVKKVLYK